MWFFFLAVSGRLGFDVYYAAVVGGVACAACTAYLVARMLVLFGGLAVLNRLDMLLLVAPVLGLVIFSRPRSAVSLWPVVLWLPVAAWYYGTPFPNTFYAKSAHSDLARDSVTASLTSVTMC